MPRWRRLLPEGSSQGSISYGAAVEVALHRDGEAELRNLPATERRAMHNAIEKLQALGDQFPYPPRRAT